MKQQEKIITEYLGLKMPPLGTDVEAADGL
jgi:hypothetical protein